ncbi:hypothetical protein XENTR_v10019488 [Xenopus tropicalis]|nr:hypothetical protein XENTR_v10019488 [Xenopus tropicalis]
MKGFLTGACVMSAVIATVYSLYCLRCFESKKRCLTYMECKEGEVCLTSYENTLYYLGETLHTPIWSGCWQSEDCNVNISFSTPLIKVRYATSCCNTDNCTAPTPTLMPLNAEKNGHTCPACHGENCIPQYSMACTGEEKTCIHFNSFLGYSRGCATTDHCNATYIVNPSLNNRYICNRNDTTLSLPVRNFLFCQSCYYRTKTCYTKLQLCGVQEDVCVTEKIRTIHTPPMDSEPNGLTCPSCYVSNSDTCLQKYPMKCVGNESHCIHYISKDTFENDVTKESFHGCTTDSICKAGSSRRHFSYPEIKAIRTTRMDLTCSKALGLNNAVQPPLVSVIIGLRVINSIF